MQWRRSAGSVAGARAAARHRSVLLRGRQMHEAEGDRLAGRTRRCRGRWIRAGFEARPAKGTGWRED